MKKSLLMSSALLGLVQTTSAVAGPDLNQIHITRKNQLRHQAEAIELAKPVRDANICVPGKPA